MTLATVPFVETLIRCRRVLLAGAGGGFDVYSAVPLYVTLRGAGVDVTLANLSFTYLDATPAPRVHGACFAVTPDCDDGVSGSIYFPELHLAAWLAERGDDSTVYAFEKTGVRPLTDAYRWLARRLDVDAVVLVDGGTDSLLRGDESGLGTPAEDASSIIAAAALDVDIKILVSVGFGIDTYHGVCHAEVLAAIADLQAAGAHLGVAALLPGSPEADALRDVVDRANRASPDTASIVANSIVSAVAGQFGDHHATARTAGSELFICPLMSLYWGFELDAVASRLLYRDAIAHTTTFRDVIASITRFRAGVARRAPRRIPF